jgi:hypothetical protein
MVPEQPELKPRFSDREAKRLARGRVCDWIGCANLVVPFIPGVLNAIGVRFLGLDRFDRLRVVREQE